MSRPHAARAWADPPSSTGSKTRAAKRRRNMKDNIIARGILEQRLVLPCQALNCCLLRAECSADRDWLVTLVKEATSTTPPAWHLFASRSPLNLVEAEALLRSIRGSVHSRCDSNTPLTPPAPWAYSGQNRAGSLQLQQLAQPTVHEPPFPCGFWRWHAEFLFAASLDFI